MEEAKTLIATPIQNDNNSEYNKYFNSILNYRPVSLELHEFNPLLNPKLSLPCLAVSLISVGLYRMKYLLVRAKILKFSSYTLNYFIFYYIGTNGIGLYNHVMTDLYSIQKDN